MKENNARGNNCICYVYVMISRTWLNLIIILLITNGRFSDILNQFSMVNGNEIIKRLIQDEIP